MATIGEHYLASTTARERRRIAATGLVGVVGAVALGAAFILDGSRAPAPECNPSDMVNEEFVITVEPGGSLWKSAATAKPPHMTTQDAVGEYTGQSGFEGDPNNVPAWATFAATMSVCPSPSE